jgi:hypothetical protein
MFISPYYDLWAGEMMETGFGWIEVDGMRYNHDIVIHADRTITKRKKKLSKGLKGEYGHTPIDDTELLFLFDEKPALVFIGTGQYGDLPVTPAAEQLLKRYITVIKPTPTLLPLIGSELRKFAAVLHVTC